MNKEKTGFVINILRWVGIILTGLCGIVLFGGDKRTSGIILVVTMIVMLLPIRNTILRRVRVGFVCVVFGFVIWNISTTDLPSDFKFTPQGADAPVETDSTGIRFVDQVIHIFKGFLEGRVFQGDW